MRDCSSEICTPFFKTSMSGLVPENYIVSAFFLASEMNEAHLQRSTQVLVILKLLLLTEEGDFLKTGGMFSGCLSVLL